MFGRRDFLRLVGLAGARSSLKCRGFGVSQAFSATKKWEFSDSKPETAFIRYVDPLPIIGVMPDAGLADRYQVAMKQFVKNVNRAAGAIPW